MESDSRVISANKVYRYEYNMIREAPVLEEYMGQFWELPEPTEEKTETARTYKLHERSYKITHDQVNAHYYGAKPVNTKKSLASDKIEQFLRELQALSAEKNQLQTASPNTGNKHPRQGKNQ